MGQLLASWRQKRGVGARHIFSNAPEAFLDPDYFSECVFAPVAKAAGIEVRFHDLRYFFVSMLITQGESPKYICDQMGHSSVQVTFDIYGHLFPRAREEAAAKLQKAMFAARRSPFGNSLVADREKSAVRPPRQGPQNSRNWLISGCLGGKWIGCGGRI